MQKLEPKWKSLYEAEFNGTAKDTAATSVQRCAAALAGSWKELYKCRLEKDREVGSLRCLDCESAGRHTAGSSVRVRSGSGRSAHVSQQVAYALTCDPMALPQVKAAAAPGETPWEQPCKWELQVALERLTAAAPAGSRGLGTSIMFLLDGSGSVTEGERRAACKLLAWLLLN